MFTFALSMVNDVLAVARDGGSRFSQEAIDQAIAATKREAVPGQSHKVYMPGYSDPVPTNVPHEAESHEIIVEIPGCFSNTDHFEIAAEYVDKCTSWLNAAGLLKPYYSRQPQMPNHGDQTKWTFYNTDSRPPSESTQNTQK